MTCAYLVLQMTCGIGSSGGLCPRLAGYVAGTGTRSGNRRRRVPSVGYPLYEIRALTVR